MDISYPQAVLLALVVCLLGGLFWGLSTSGGAFDPYNHGWDGTSDLRTDFDDDAEVIVARSTGAYGDVQARNTAAVVLEPGGRYSPSERARLSSFLGRGGTLVVAAASQESNELLAAVGTTIRINGTPVRDEQSYDSDPAFPVANDVSSDDRLRGVDALTLNHGTVLDVGEGRRLANTSAVAYRDENRNETLDGDETLGSYPVAATERVGAGQVVVLSDPSIFTNAMLQREGNRRFVRNLAVDHDRLLLDYSQQEGFPPLSYALLVVRSTPLLQLLVGVAGIGAVALFGRVRPVDRARELWRRLRDTPSPGGAGEGPLSEGSVDEVTLAAFLRGRHPEWDDERVARVTKAVIRQRRQGGDND